MEYSWKIICTNLLLFWAQTSVSIAAKTSNQTEIIIPSKVTTILVEANAAFHKPTQNSMPPTRPVFTTDSFQLNSKTRLQTSPRWVTQRTVKHSSVQESSAKILESKETKEIWPTGKMALYPRLHKPAEETSRSKPTRINLVSHSFGQESLTTEPTLTPKLTWTDTSYSTSPTFSSSSTYYPYYSSSSSTSTFSSSSSSSPYSSTSFMHSTTRNALRESELTSTREKIPNFRTFHPKPSSSTTNRVRKPSYRLRSTDSSTLAKTTFTSVGPESSIQQILRSSTTPKIIFATPAGKTKTTKIDLKSSLLPSLGSTSSTRDTSTSGITTVTNISETEGSRRTVVTASEPSRIVISSSTTPSKDFKHLEGRGTSKTVTPHKKNESSNNQKKKDRKKKQKEERKKKRKESTAVKENKTVEESSQDTQTPKVSASVIPVHYVLRIRPELAGNFVVRGVIEIELEIRAPTHRMKLNSGNIDVKKSSIEITSMKAHKKVPIKGVRISSKRQILSLKLGRRLKPGRAYILHMEFSYRLKREGRGFYRRPYLDQNGDRRWLAVTRFWPSFARRAFPCFDDPDLRATFDIHLAHTPDLKAISNMPVVRSYRIMEDPNLVWDQFATTPKMPINLLAFAITDFTYIRNDEDSDVPIRVWGKDEVVNQTETALRFISSSLDYFEKYFNIKYSLPKLDVIALPSSVPKVPKSWGLLSFRESSLILSDNLDHNSKLELAILLAREVAHQWLGALVSTDFSHDIWFNEGLADYLGLMAINEIEPSLNALEGFTVNWLQPSLAKEGQSISPVSPQEESQQHSTKRRIDSLQDLYSKGASLVRMMQHFLTEQTFQNGIQNYLTRFSFKNAKQSDLWEELNKAAVEDGSLPIGVDVQSILDTWTNQSGYPVINILRSDNTSATLSQRRFQMNQMNGTTEDSTWWVPITFTSEGRASFRHTRAQTWLREGVPTLKVTGLPPVDQWVIFNLQATGYYRVNYDSRTWDLLIRQLKKDPSVIHVANRAQLVDDSLNLAKSGKLSYAIAFELLTYLRFERDVTPWMSALRNLRYINSMLRRTKDYGSFKKFVFSLMDPLAGSIGIENVGGDSIKKNHLRGALRETACQMGHPLCVQKANDFFQDWKNRTSFFRYEDSFDFEIFCVGIREGDEEMWNFFWDISQRVNEIKSRRALLKALSCTKKVWILTRYLQAIGEPSLSFLRDDIYHIYEASLMTAVGDFVAWEAFRISWENFKNNSDFIQHIAPEIIEVLTAGFNTQHQSNELEAFYSRVSQQTSKETSVDLVEALKEALANSRFNINWFKSSYDSIIRWLSDNGFTSNLMNLQINVAT